MHTMLHPIPLSSPTPPFPRISSRPTVCTRSKPPRLAAAYQSTERQLPPPSYNRCTMASSPASFYQVLGLSSGATCQEIKTAYRRLARVCHPDVVATDRKDTSADEFMRIHAAYSTLSDPEKRADYDRTLLRVHQSRPFGSSSYSGSRFGTYGRRTWETDQCW